LLILECDMTQSNSRFAALTVDCSTLGTAIHRFRLNLMRQNNFRIFKEHRSLDAKPACTGLSTKPRREATHALHATHGSLHLSSAPSGWWSQSGSNRRPPACKAGALPAELWPLMCPRGIAAPDFQRGWRRAPHLCWTGGSGRI
jgi:hypothetical protein